VQDSSHFRQLKHQIELKEHELRLLDERIADSVFAQLERDVVASEEQFAQDKELLITKKEAVAQLTKEVKSLDADIANLKESRQSKISVLEKRFAEAKKDTQKIGVHLKTVQQELSELVLESESAEQELAGNNESVSGIQKELAALRKEEKKMEDKLAEVQCTYEKASKKLEERRSNLTLCDQQLKELGARQAALSKKKSDLEIERKKAEHKISRMAKDKRRQDDGQEAGEGAPVDRDREGVLRPRTHRLRFPASRSLDRQSPPAGAQGSAGRAVQEDQQEGHGHDREGRARVPRADEQATHHRER